MASDLFGAEALEDAEATLPEPPPPDGPGLFGATLSTGAERLGAEQMGAELIAAERSGAEAVGGTPPNLPRTGSPPGSTDTALAQVAAEPAIGDVSSDVSDGGSPETAAANDTAASGAAGGAALPTAPADGKGRPAATSPYRVLARKYRPVAMAELIGQDALVRTLRNAFADGRVAHGFMLTGVRGVGKTTTARIIARALNCVGPDGSGGPTADPCGVCFECRAILADRHPDVMELDAASNNGVDYVRELKEAVRFRPAQGRAKVYILDEVHMLSPAAFAALLKMLEEPPRAVTFIFATTELRKVPATILSRCQTFHLKRVSQALLVEHFATICAAEDVTVEPEALAIVARAAEGSVRDGLSLLDQAIVQAGLGGRAAGSGVAVTATTVREMLGLADRGLTLELLEAALRGDLPGALALADRAHMDGADPHVLLSDLLALTHTLTRLVTVPGLAASGTLEESLRERGGALAASLSVPVLGRAWQVLLKGLSELAEAPDRHAAADMVLIRLVHAATLPTPGEIVRRLQPEPGSDTSGAQKLPRAGAGAGAGAGTGSGAGLGAGGAAVGTALADRRGGEAVAAALAAPSATAGVSAGMAARVAGGGGGRALAGSAAAVLAGPALSTLAGPDSAPAGLPQSAVAPPPPPPSPRTWPEIVALASGVAPLLHAWLRQGVHPVAVAPGRIEMRVTQDAPRDLAGQLAGLLQSRTGARWTVVLSNAAGGPTLDAQGAVAAADRREAAARHPLVRAVLATFPGATIEAVREHGTDAYGLTPGGGNAMDAADAPLPDPIPADPDAPEEDA